MKIKQLIVTLMVISIGAGLAACGSGSSDPQNIAAGTYNLVFTPGAYDSTVGNGMSCIGGESEAQIMTVAADNSTAYSEVKVSPGSTLATFYTGNFTNPVNQNSPCFTGNIQITAPQCGSINNNSTIQFVACNYVPVGNYYQFTATYQIYSTNVQTGTKGIVLQGQVMGTGA